MSTTQLVSPPTRVQAVDVNRFFTREWRNYFLSLQNVAESTPQFLFQTTISGQHASIVTTPMTLPALSSGLYRVNIYQTIAVADTVSSSLTTTIGWTDLAVAKTFSTAAMTGNVTTANDSVVRMIHIDNASPITYATTYASNTPGAMQYALGIVVEKL